MTNITHALIISFTTLMPKQFRIFSGKKMLTSIKHGEVILQETIERVGVFHTLVHQGSQMSKQAFQVAVKQRDFLEETKAELAL